MWFHERVVRHRQRAATSRMAGNIPRGIASPLEPEVTPISARRLKGTTPI